MRPYGLACAWYSEVSVVCVTGVQGSELEWLLKILESSDDPDEKLDALNRIDEIAKTRTDIG